MAHSIVIVGAGFAALSAARSLRRHDPSASITLLAPRREFVFLPSLIWIPSGKRKASDIIVPLDKFLSKHNIAFVEAEATGLEEEGRKLLTTAGPLHNDGLIIASGGRFIKKLPGIEHAILPCEGVAAAEKLRDRLEALEEGTVAFGFSGNPNEPTAMRGGPIFEFLLGTDTLLRKQKRRNRIRLAFFNPMPSPWQRLGESAVRRLMQQMKERGIETYLGHKLVGFEESKVKTEGAEFAADIIVFMPGMTGNAWFDATPLPRSPGGFVQADEMCRVAGFERIYVAGDAGSYPGPDWMPKQAHMADMQAEAAATNLVAELAGSVPENRFQVELACIVDSLDTGMLVRRTEKGAMAMPPLGLMHSAKAAFERWYLRRYRL